MAIDQQYIPAFEIETVILDKDTGAPLSGGLVYFWRDSQPTDRKPVYQITGTSPDYSYTALPNPMTLSSIGTFVDSMDNPVIPYFFPFLAGTTTPDYYFVEVTNSLGVPQFTREPVPYIPDSSTPGSAATTYTNEISNPQFIDVLFDTNTVPYVYNFSAGADQVQALAADWDLVVTSAGSSTVTVTQIKPAGTSNIPTNPGTLLKISNAGATSVKLRQRLYGSPNLWGNAYLAGSITGKTYTGSVTTFNVLYSYFDGLAVADETIIAVSFPAAGSYVTRPGNILLPATANPSTYPDAYIDIIIDLPIGQEVEITSLMIAGTGSNNVSEIGYEQTTQARQTDQLFNYFKPQLDFKPIPSMLVGWDFPLNPAQINGTTFTMTTSGLYVWDQTIGQCIVNTCAVARNSVTGGIQVTTADASQSFYFLQYLSGNEAKKILQGQLSVNVQAYRTQAGGAVTARVYLYRGSSAATFPDLATGVTIGALSANGTFALTAANWTEIPRGNLGLAIGTLPTVNTTDYSTLNDAEDLSFFGWDITDATQISNTDKFAIVVTYQCPTAATVVTTNSISLVPGNIPTRPAPQAADEVIRECGRYFETSFNVGFRPGSAATTDGMRTCHQNIIRGGSTDLYATPFEIRYVSTKVSPTNTSLVLYTPAGAGAANLVQVGFYNGSALSNTAQPASTNWVINGFGQHGVTFVPNSTGSLANRGGVEANLAGVVNFHYTASSRLGLEVL